MHPCRKGVKCVSVCRTQDMFGMTKHLHSCCHLMKTKSSKCNVSAAASLSNSQ
jgi:hypothetical protein